MDNKDNEEGSFILNKNENYKLFYNDENDEELDYYNSFLNF